MRSSQVAPQVGADVETLHHGLRRPRIQLLQVSDCPLVSEVRATLESCLDEAGLRAEVEDVVGEYASPTLLIDELDVTTRAVAPAAVCCRLDLPTRSQILAALRTDLR